MVSEIHYCEQIRHHRRSGTTPCHRIYRQPCRYPCRAQSHPRAAKHSGNKAGRGFFSDE